MIKLLTHYPYGQFYIAVFEWTEGECLFDHWNFEKYAQSPSDVRPADQFHALPVEKKLRVAEVIFSFLEAVAEKGYVAVDFYDGSILYDFETETTTICDIDLFRKMPAFNDMGETFWGTKRLKAPEEYRKDAVIDEVTNVYTLGAMLFDFFGAFCEADIARRYEEKRFLPCDIQNWSLNKASYAVLKKATASKREERYAAISVFHSAWKAALQKK